MREAGTERGADARFRSRYDLRALVDVVAAVARVVRPDAPMEVTQRQWDEARAVAGYPDAPTARQAAERLRSSWPELLALALDGRDVAKALGYLFSEDDDLYFDGDDVRAALRTVARRLGVRSLTPDDYDGERERMLRAARRRRHPSELALPAAFRCERIVGSWDAALAVAGLESRPEQARARGVSAVDVIELCLEAHGALPTKKELERFTQANRLSASRRKAGQAWADDIAELRRRRDEWGKWTPPGPPPLEARPDYSVPVPLPPDLPRRRKFEWTRAECVVAIGRVFEEMGGERLTLKRYQQAARGRRDLPALVAIQRHGSFSELAAEAREARSAISQWGR